MAMGKAKTEHAFQTFHKNLKDNDFPPVIFMYGGEEYLTEWAVKSLADKFTDANMRDMDFIRLDEEESSVDAILAACDTLSIFSEKRIIWVQNFMPLIKKNSKGFGEKEIKQLNEYIDNPNEMAILVFSCVKPDEGSSLVKLLKKQCRVYNFTSLDMTQISAFAEKRFKTSGIQITKSDLKYFIDETGYFNRDSEYKIYNLENDIKKLIAYCEANTVKREDIDMTLHGDLDRFAFNFIDAINNNKKDTAFRLLNNMMGSGSEVFSLLGLLINQFELMYESKELKDESMSYEEIAKVLKVNSYRVKKALAASDKLSYKKIKNILSQLYETDRNIKTGLIDQNLALELIIGRM